MVTINLMQVLDRVDKWAARRIASEKVTTEQVRTIMASNGGLCVYCNQATADTLDHIVPLSRGGPHALSNLAGACGPCNSKHALTPTEWAAKKAAQLPSKEAY